MGGSISVEQGKSSRSRSIFRSTQSNAPIDAEDDSNSKIVHFPTLCGMCSLRVLLADVALSLSPTVRLQ